MNDSSVIVSVLKSHLLGKGDIKTLKSYYPVLESKNEKGKIVTEYQNRYNIMYGEGLSETQNEAIRYDDMCYIILRYDNVRAWGMVMTYK